MKLPEKCPEWHQIMQRDSFKKFFEDSKEEKIRKIVSDANKNYYYWSKVRSAYGLTFAEAQTAWAHIKFSRMAQRRTIPLRDTQGRAFAYWLPDTFLKQLHYLDQNASGEILSGDPDVPSGEKERFLISSIMEESIASSQLEGAAVTREKAKEMLRAARKPHGRGEPMIYNNYRTIMMLKDIINEPLSLDMLLKIQSMITEDALDDPSASGRLRKPEESIEVAMLDGTVVHTPPPAKELSERMQLLCRYANENDTEEEFTHPVVKAIILHFWLAYDHPFVDGNGRTARALFYWYMLKAGYWMTEYLSISRIMIKAPMQYTRAYLYAELDDQDLTYFLSFHLRTLRLAVTELQNYLADKVKEIREISPQLVRYQGLNYRQSNLIHHALTHPGAVYTVRGHRNSWKVTYQTARTDLLGLEKIGLFLKAKKGKEFLFFATENLSKKLKLSKKK